MTPALDEPLGRATMRRVTLRILPYLFVLYLLNYLDRTNVSIAALQMNRDLHFPAATMLGLGLLYAGTTGVLAAFWCLPGMVLRGRDAAVGIALVNAIGNVGGFVGPAAVGRLRDAAGDPRIRYVALLAGALGTLCSAFVLRRWLARPPAAFLGVPAAA